MARQLRARMMALAEDPDLLPGTHSWLTATSNFSSRGSSALFWPPWVPGLQMVNSSTCGQTIHKHKQNVTLKQ